MKPRRPVPTHDFGPDLAVKLETFLKSEYTFGIFDDPFNLFDSEEDVKRVSEQMAARLTGAVTPRQFVEVWYMLRPHARTLANIVYIKRFLKQQDVDQRFIHRVGSAELQVYTDTVASDGFRTIPKTAEEWVRMAFIPRFGAGEMSGWVLVSIYISMALALFGAALSAVLPRELVNEFILKSGTVIALALIMAIAVDSAIFGFGFIMQFISAATNLLFQQVNGVIGNRAISVVIMLLVMAFFVFGARYSWDGLIMSFLGMALGVPVGSRLILWITRTRRTDAKSA